MSRPRSNEKNKAVPPPPQNANIMLESPWGNHTLLVNLPLFLLNTDRGGSGEEGEEGGGEAVCLCVCLCVWLAGWLVGWLTVC